MALTVRTDRARKQSCYDTPKEWRPGVPKGKGETSRPGFKVEWHSTRAYLRDGQPPLTGEDLNSAGQCACVILAAGSQTLKATAMFLGAPIALWPGTQVDGPSMGSRVAGDAGTRTDSNTPRAHRREDSGLARGREGCGR